MPLILLFLLLASFEPISTEKPCTMGSQNIAMNLRSVCMYGKTNEFTWWSLLINTKYRQDSFFQVIWDDVKETIMYTKNVRFWGKQQAVFSRVTRAGLEENKPNWFPARPDIKYLVIFQDFHIKSHK